MSNTDTPPPPSLPPKFNRGDPIKASALESMRANIGHALNGLIKGGKGILVTNTGNSVIINSTAKGGAARAPVHPLKVYRATNDAGDDGLIKFAYGTVNGEAPTIGDPPVAITLDRDDAANPTIQLTGTATHFVYLKVTLNASFQPTAYQIETATTRPTDTSTAGHYELAIINTEADVITEIFQSWTTNVTYFYAGDDNHIFFA